MRRLKALWITLAAVLWLGAPAGAGQTPPEPPPVQGSQANFAGWLAEAVKDYLLAELTEQGRQVDSIETHVPSLYKPPSDYDTFDISMPRQSTKGSRVFLLVSFVRDERVVSKLNVIATVKVKARMAVAARDLGRGAIIAEQDLHMVTRSVSPFTDNLVFEPAGAVGRRLDRNVREGAPLRADQLIRPKLVNNGDIVMVVAEQGPMLITTTGRARQDGDRGEWIKVTNIGSKKIITARVVGPNEVRVEF